MVIKKKSHPKFIVPNFGAKHKTRVKERWRHQRGIDSKKRKKKAFMGAEPTIGYRNPKSIRHRLADNNYAVLVHNPEELINIINNPNINEFDVVISKSVGKKKRIIIKEVAEKNGVRVRNGA